MLGLCRAVILTDNFLRHAVDFDFIQKFHFEVLKSKSCHEVIRRHPSEAIKWMKYVLNRWVQCDSQDTGSKQIGPGPDS